MHNGNGKRWLLIGLLVLGGFWLVNDAYDDGYRDALVQTGQVQNVRHYRGGPHFPWGLVILGGIGYLAWRKGAFDRFGGPDNPFSGGHRNGEPGMQRYGAGGGPAQMSGRGFGPGFRGPRAFFDEWHRQAHEEAARAQYPAPPTPPAAPAPPASAPAATPAAGAAEGGMTSTPAPTPPAPEYWASMGGATGASSNPAAPGAAEAGRDGSPDGSRSGTGTPV